MLERWLIATEVDMRTFVQNERVSIIIRITTWREKQTNNYYIIKMHEIPAATSTYISTWHTQLYTVSECFWLTDKHSYCLVPRTHKKEKQTGNWWVSSFYILNQLWMFHQAEIYLLSVSGAVGARCLQRSVFSKIWSRSVKVENL